MKTTIEEIIKDFKEDLLTQFPINTDGLDDELMLQKLLYNLEIQILRHIEARDIRIEKTGK